MELKEKIEMWLSNLRLFSINAEVHCSREEKKLEQEHIGTRHVNQAFNGLLKYIDLLKLEKELVELRLNIEL